MVGIRTEDGFTYFYLSETERIPLALFIFGIVFVLFLLALGLYGIFGKDE